MIDIKKEQKASLARKRYKYSFAAKFFFFMMDIIAGKTTTLAKAKLIETLASIPYRAWEIRQYKRMTRKYKDEGFVQKARKLMLWGREAQDNEYWHLLVINEKMKEDNVKDQWYLNPIVLFLLVNTYILISRILATFNISRAFLFNAEFEDHAEHVYAKFAEDHPEWDTQPVNSNLVKEYGDFQTWGDVFRRIGLDERDHMNNSFIFCGKPEAVVNYEGIPELPIILQGTSMRIRIASIFVDGQDKALKFYTEKLGFMKKDDIPTGDFRWLTVVSPDAPEGMELLLEPNAHKSAKAYQKAIFEDSIPATSLFVNDIQKEYKRLKQLGVEFTTEPTKTGTVTIAVFDDTCGNLIQLVEQ